MRELDLVLTGWMDQCYEQASASDRQLFSHLLELPDPEIAGYLLGRHCPGDPALARLVEQLSRLTV